MCSMSETCTREGTDLYTRGGFNTLHMARLGLLQDNGNSCDWKCRLWFLSGIMTLCSRMSTDYMVGSNTTIRGMSSSHCFVLETAYYPLSSSKTNRCETALRVSVRTAPIETSSPLTSVSFILPIVKQGGILKMIKTRLITGVEEVCVPERQRQDLLHVNLPLQHFHHLPFLWSLFHLFSSNQVHRFWGQDQVSLNTLNTEKTEEG